MSAKTRFDIEYMVLKAYVGCWILLFCPVECTESQARRPAECEPRHGRLNLIVGSVYRRVTHIVLFGRAVSANLRAVQPAHYLVNPCIAEP